MENEKRGQELAVARLNLGTIDTNVRYLRKQKVQEQEFTEVCEEIEGLVRQTQEAIAEVSKQVKLLENALKNGQYGEALKIVNLMLYGTQ